MPLSFDAAALKSDVADLAHGDWIPHFNTSYHEGGWSGVALYSIDGDAQYLYPDPNRVDAVGPTPIMARCPAIRAALSKLQCRLQSARLLRLAAGARIREHRDYGVGMDQGAIRLHIPIITSPDVEFYLDGVRVPMSEGECWYLDFSLPHRVQNHGKRDRVHLVVDCNVNDWLCSLLPSGGEDQEQIQRVITQASETSQRRFEDFRARVLLEPDLQNLLRHCEDTADFVQLVTKTGNSLGFSFTAEDVESAIHAGRRSWIERHLF